MSNPRRAKQRKLIGVVTSNKMDKTITVRVERLVKHPRYKKYLRAITAYKAHDEENKAGIGDSVEIAETRPLSKTKRWRLVRIVGADSSQGLSGVSSPEEAVIGETQ